MTVSRRSGWSASRVEVPMLARVRGEVLRGTSLTPPEPQVAASPPALVALVEPRASSHEPVGRSLPGEAFRPVPRRAPHGLVPRLVGHERDRLGGERQRVAGSREQAGAAVADGVPDPADVVADGGRAHGVRLDDDHAPALAHRGHEQAMRHRHPRVQLVARQAAEEHGVFRAASARARPRAGPSRRSRGEPRGART